jgi:hypothetical protein
MPSRSLSNETYVIDLCDEVLGAVALRQHSFDFLRGDSGPGRQGKRLPVDAYTPSCNSLSNTASASTPKRSQSWTGV